MPPRRTSTQTAAEKHGWRSGLEEKIGAQLDAEGIAYEYETLVIPFTQPVKPRKYTPDYVITHNGIIIESKGRFVTADRQKHLLVQAQHPDLDLRFVFSNSKTRISKQSRTTYGQWCESKGFLYADKIVPLEWLMEQPNRASLRSIKNLMERT
jgi:hypothetical protein